ncbi:SDR family NAD(P)-dependent oxidoreductase [Pendulispora rubella]|uniref:SDR family NAD(P)-dependent oxidoreductase n=1 Tax=Pendulispora rubella TaxID=2741070 RepID=A0ABZ2L959_9BACT
MNRTEDDLRGWIASSLAKRLGIEARDIDPCERFTRYGLDSIGAVGLVAELSDLLGRRLSPVLIWQHPTPEELARALVSSKKASAPAPSAETPLADAPIAIVGIACRFPGASDPRSFWTLLRDGGDAVTEAPRERWGVEGPRGGFLDEVDGFDPGFFGIVPREVSTMDPQQRLMLELSWEALEDAGIVPATLRGSATGVFVGSIWDDYAMLAYQRTLTAHTVTGHHRSILANRVSYTFDLHGPSMTVDSACSSALVTVQLACESLRRGETSLALAGGVNLNLVPQSAFAVAEMGALSPDGRCFTFDARANGYVRGEGGGVVVLKRVSDALRDGDAIYCVVRGGAVNNNGAGNGLTAPSPEAQEALLRQAYARAGIEPEHVDYVELHGTGTALGDPIEATALGAVLGKPRPAERPLRVGSAKTNVGHLEGAAGVVGLLKVVLSLQHGQLPPSLHFESANPLIPMDELHLKVQRTLEPWPDSGRPLVAGVSSFGLGGTNAHVVLSQWLPPAPQILALSAESPEALRHEAERWQAEARPTATRTGEHRLAVTARSDADRTHRLQAFLEGGRGAGVSVGRAASLPPRVAFVFAGQGAQWWGMGRGLLQREPVFRATLEACSHWIERELGCSLLDELSADRGRSRLDRIEVSLPAIIATEIAVAAQWRAWGIEPSVVVGQSTGEIAAAHVAGVLDLEDAMRTICAYGRVIARQRGQGAMGVVGLSWDDAGAELAGHPGRLFRAIQHSADSTVLAGEPEALDALFEGLERRKVFCRRVAMDVAPHCPLVDGFRAELMESLRNVRPRAGHIPIVSEVTGTRLDGERFDAEHWVRNFGDPALFSTAVHRLIDEGYELFVETSPHPLVLPAVESNLRHAGRHGVTLASMRRDEDEHQVMLDTLGALHARGVAVAWDALAPWDRHADPARTSPVPLVFPVSGKGEAALAAQAARLAEHLAERVDVELPDLAHSLATARAHFEHRAAVVARDRAELAEGLASLAEGRPAPNVVLGRSARPGKVVFVFPGQGSQWQGMARALLASSPVFREQLLACVQALAPHLDDVDLLAVLRGDEGAASLDRVDVVQPALFAVMVSLAALWRSMGVEPDAVIGHSQGEIAAAYVAGALSLDEAAKVVALRSRALATVAGGGAMAAIELGVRELESYLAPFGDGLSIAATNSARATLVSGDAERIDALLERLAAAEIFARKIRVDYASHSSQMESVRDAILAPLRDLSPRSCARPLYSTVTGAPIDGAELGAEYWYLNLRQTVRFADATSRLVADGHRFFVEVSPHPVLTLALGELASSGVVGSLRREAGGMEQILRALAELHTRGLRVDWARVLPRARRVRLPTYAFQRQRFWLEPAPVLAKPRGEGHPLHPLYGERLPSPGAEVLFLAPVDLERQGYLAEHRVFDQVVAPGAFHLAALISAAEEAFASTSLALERVEWPRPLPLAAGETAWLHMVLSPGPSADAHSFSSSTPDPEGAGWHAHARGILRLECPAVPDADLSEERARCRGPVDPASLYDELRASEILLGASFQRIESLARSEGEVLAKLRVEPDPHGPLHPTELDACLQTLAAASGAGGGPFVPFALERLAFYGRGHGPTWCHARLRTANDDGCVGDLRVLDEAGRMVAELEGLHLKRASKEAMLGRETAHARWGYEVAWTKQPRGATHAAPGAWVIVGVEDPLGPAVAAALSAKGAEVTEEAGWQRARGIVLLCPEQGIGAPQEQAYEKVLGWVKALSGAVSRNVPRLYVVTRGTQQVASGEPVQPALAILWGMGRTVRYEHPELACTLVDLSDAGEDEAGDLVGELLSGSREDEIALRPSGRYVGRLAPRGASKAPAHDVAVRADATYLVTGGLGALGRRAAAWLVARGARSLVLVGRNGAHTPEQMESIAHLEAQGARVVLVQADIGDALQVERLLRNLDAELPPLRGVVHAAGLLDDALLAGQNLDRYRTVARPKVWGAHHLDRLTRGKGLDFFVLYSSVASVLGSPGQANYAAANAFLDALARQRRAEGESALSIDWGAFADEGLAAAHENRGARLSARGIRSFSPEEGIALLEAALAQPSPQIAWMDIDGRQWVEFYPQMAHSPRLSPLLKAQPAPNSRKALPAAERPANVEVFVREQVAIVTRLDASAIAADVPLTALGLDSLMGLELRNRLEAGLGLRLPATLIWTYPSLAALTGYLTASIQGASPAVREDVARPDAAEPIAIVGMACRFPGGADDPASFWRLLVEGVDAVTEIPDARWPSGSRPAPGAAGTKWAALLDSVDGFDADFFGISPREAVGIDPQHRLLLELTWEALEDAHVVPEQLVGSKTGVFVGVMGHDYNLRTLARPSSELDVYSSTGNGSSFAAGRISYVFGLQGPCLAVDTACSSSLVAVHLACQSLRQGESRLALAAGVNLILSPLSMEVVARTQALSPDGRCRAFDARANGFVRGEGGGVLMLERLSDAKAAGHRIWAVIRGSATNQDGRSTGLTAPNVLSQQELLTEALRSAGLEGHEVGYVEAHGTGTSLGDPIEFEALKTVLGAPRANGMVCALGSVKTNLGHLEAAAGMAGLIKAVLSLEHELVPRHLHFETLNPRMSLEGTPFVIPTEARPWKKTGELPRVAGISSFGLSGMNAHVLVEEAPAMVPAGPADAPAAFLLPLSAKSPAALSELARAYAVHVEGPQTLKDICDTAATRRSHHAHRLAVVARSPADMAERLTALARGESRPHCSLGGRRVEGRRVFVFPGQGSQWVGMGRGLLEREPVFRAALEACDAALRPWVGWGLLEALASPEMPALLERVDYVQPMLFAMQVALAAQWRAWGIEPDAVVGHSMGEVAAAHVARVLSLEDAAAILGVRSAAVATMQGQGGMALVELPRDEAERRLRGLEDRLAVAAHNGPRTCLLSGTLADLETLLAQLEREGIFCRRVKVTYASHSPQMDALAAGLRTRLAKLAPVAAKVPMLSTVTGEWVQGRELGTEYWIRNLREPVRFWDAVQRLEHEGHRIFLEVSAHPVLVPSLEDGFASMGRAAAAFSTLRRDEDEPSSMLATLGALYTSGQPVPFARGNEAAPVRGLPRYPWQRERFWIEESAVRRTEEGHPLLGAHLEASRGKHYFSTEIGAARPAYLADHRAGGAVLFPGAGYVEMALAGAHRIFGGPHRIDEAHFEEMLILGETPITLQLAIDAERLAFEIFSRTETAWTLHARGTLKAESAAPEANVSLDALRARCPETVTSDAHYQGLRRLGLDYGPAFQGVREVHRGAGEALGRVRIPEALEADVAAYGLHPALFDACLQLAGGLMSAEGKEERRALPVAARSVRILGALRGELWCHAVRTSPSSVRIEVYDGSGNRVLEVGSFEVRFLERPRNEPFYGVEWITQPLAPAPAEGRASWVLVAHEGETLGAKLEAIGHRVVRISPESFELGETLALERTLRDALAAADAPCRGIVHMGNLWGPEPRTSTALQEAQRCGYESVLAVAQAVARMGLRDAPRLWLVTGGAQHVLPGQRDGTPASAPVWGLGRTMAHEMPELRCACVDLSVSPDAQELDALANELRNEEGREDQIGLRGSLRFVARLTRHAPSELVPRAEHPYRMRMPKAGVFDDIGYAAVPRQDALAEGDVELEVSAAGLNFLDVLTALGAIGDLDGSGDVALGFECAGRIARVGPGVSGLYPGQEVLAIAPGAFASHAVTSASLVVPKPEAMRPEEAAAIPVAFMTAVYALEDVARLRPGERVLIHAAAGGVGLAAVQIAQSLGAEIFATAGSEDKRALLRSLGVAHVMDSRSLAFADEVLARTNGEGVDVVLNSLGGPFIAKSLGVLRNYGRFVEIGKRDYFDDQPLGLRPFLKKLTFSLVDLRGMTRERPQLVQRLFREVVARFESGALRVPPLRTYPAAQAVEAFRFMAQGAHTGKLVLSFGAKADAPAMISGEVRIRPDGTYLVTGGLGGVGLELAGALASRGARHLVLAGRRAPSPEAVAKLDALRAAGVAVEAVKLDVADAAQVEALVSRMGADLPPLRGIVHAAAVLADATLLRTTAESCRSVAAPKILGAWNLHASTAGQPLDFFVLCSSVASVLGSPGQGNYSAANAFLDALAHHRRAQGRPASSINFGPWAEIGLAAASSDRGERIALRGIESFDPAEGADVFLRLLASSSAQVAAMRFHVRQWTESYLSAARSPLLSELARHERAPVGASAQAFRDRVRSMAPAERPTAIVRELQQQLGHVLRRAPDAIDAAAPFKSLGVDSLMAIEFRNRLETALGASLSAALIWQHPSIEALATHLAGRMDEAPPIEPAPPAPPPVAEVSAQGAQHILQALKKLATRTSGAKLPESEPQ